MAWDAFHKNLAMKAVATVESNMRYDVIYYADAITIGIIQWYGGRAVELLNRMRGIPEFGQLPQRLRDALVAHPDPSRDWNWWTTFYLTRDEGDAIKKVMVTANAKKIQNAEAIKELQSYYEPYKRLGFDPERNTENFCLFCVCYHQHPAGARAVWRNVSQTSSLDHIFSAIMQHRWLRGFRSRYEKAVAIIKSRNISGLPPGLAVGDNGVPVDGVAGEDLPGNVGDDGFISGLTTFNHAKMVGNSIHVVGSFGTVVFYPTGGNYFVPKNRQYQALSPDNPVPGAGAWDGRDPGGKRAELVNWVRSRIGKYRYSQGPGRDNPDVSGVTDCSALMYRAYLDVAGIQIGFSTHTQYNQGTHVFSSLLPRQPIPLGLLAPGDLIYFDWVSNGSTWYYDHVEMYVGDGKTIGHGGRPFMGPVEKSLESQSRIALRVRVNRHING